MQQTHSYTYEIKDGIKETSTAKDREAAYKLFIKSLEWIGLTSLPLLSENQNKQYFQNIATIGK